MKLTLDQALQQAIEANKSGKYRDAERLYGSILETYPKHPVANHNLGLLSVILGKFDVALHLLKTALEANPKKGLYWISYLETLIKTGQTDNAQKVLHHGRQIGLQGEAIDRLEQYLKTVVQASKNSNDQGLLPLAPAINMRETGKYTEAEEWLNKWLETHENDVNALSLLTQVLLLDKKNDEAQRVHMISTNIAPDIPSVMRNHARLLLQQSRSVDALYTAKSAYDNSSHDPESWLVLAAALSANQKDNEALQHVERALRARPNYAEAYTNRAMIRLRAQDRVGALTDLEKALDIKPHLTQLWVFVAKLHYQSNNLAGAINALEKAIELEPTNVAYMVDLGDFFRQNNEVEKAINILESAVEKEILNAHVWVNLGTAFQQGKRIVEAKAAYEKALAINPQSAEVANNLGALAKDDEDWENALRFFKKAIKIKPELAEAHSNLGIALQEFGRLYEAEASCRKAISLNPEYVEGYINLGVVLKGSGRFSEAEASYRQAIALKPDYAQGYMNLGVVLKESGKLYEAEAGYRQAIALKPDYAEAYNNLGNVITEISRLCEAEACYRQAIVLKPDYAEAYLNLGVVLKESGRLYEAEASYRQAITLKPDYAEAYSNLGNVLVDIGRLNEAEVNYRQAIFYKPNYAEAHNNLLFSINYIEKLSPGKLLDDAKHFAAISAKLAKFKYAKWKSIYLPEKLKIAFVSGDLREHPVGYFLEGLLSHIDKSKFELIGYTNAAKEDKLTNRIKPFFSKWVPIHSKNDESVAHLIHRDAPHILIDLSGHTAHNRLLVFTYKPAPVQLTWLGYSGSTGLDEMDYILGDEHIMPYGEEHHYTEQVWRLPETFLCYTPPINDVPVGPLPALAHGYVTFGSFNNLSKMNDAVVRLWVNILQAVPNSHLFLKTKQLGNPQVIEDTKERFAVFGITADRLILAGNMEQTNHFETYNRVDIALDPFPYTGVTTSVDALWMGVPVITLRGDRFLSHCGESIAHNSGQSEWIACDEADYLKKAVAFSSDLHGLASLRRGLRDKIQLSPLFNASRFAHYFEEAMWGMWNKWKKENELTH